MPNHLIPTDMLQTAADWLARVEASPGDSIVAAQFDSWLAADPAHRLAYAEAASVYWGAVATGEGATAAHRQSAEANESTVPPLRGARAHPHPHANAHAHAHPHAQARSRPSTNARTRWRARGVGLFLGAASVVLMAWGILFGSHTMQNWQADLVTSTGETRNESLPDGSTVQLDADSAVRVRVGAHGAREVELLRGAAAFTVTHDETRPFTVRAGEFEVKDLGTEFVLKPQRDGLSIVVNEGVVEWSHPLDDGAILNAGEAIALKLDASQNKIARHPLQDHSAIQAWTRAQFVFSKTPLEEAIAELDRHLPERVLLLAKSEARINLIAPHQDAAGALNTIARHHGLNVRRLPGVWIVSD